MRTLATMLLAMWLCLPQSCLPDDMPYWEQLQDRDTVVVTYGTTIQ